ncbi:MAG: exodeoxyribonuclease V subunit gamma [Polyangiales bacterium]
MLRLVYANQTEALLEAFVDRVREQRSQSSPLVPIELIVPGRHVERYLEVRCAEAMGVAANLRFHRLESFAARWVSTRGDYPLGRRSFEAVTLAVLLDDAALSQPALFPLLQYLDASLSEGARDASRAQLAMRMATLFEGYALSRPALLATWESDSGNLGLPANATPAQRDDAMWQRALYREVRRRSERRPLAAHLRELQQGAAGKGNKLPTALHVFGLSYVAPVYSWLFSALGQRTELDLYTLNPCMEFWEDLPSEHERSRELPTRQSARGGTLLEEHPHLLGDDPPALTFWGRPGREHVLLLNEMSGADFEPRFVDPGHGTVLARIQKDILERTLRTAQGPADGSLVATECPNVRRELETVAEAIWSAVREDSTLRFNDIAVFVPPSDRSAYLPHLSAVFREAQDLPHHVVDLPLLSESRIVEAAALLVDLPTSAMRRPDLLEVLMHPATHTPKAGSASWASLIDALGIFHGLDASDHEGTYILGDLVSWDQGVRRLSLGAFMDEDASIQVGTEHYYSATTHSDDEGAWLAALIRSLCADVKFARDARLPIADWSVFFAGMFRAYLRPSDSREESELRRCLQAADALGEGGLVEPVGFRLAAELLRASIDRLGGARGEYLADGVVVSALSPMRAIPFRRVFVLGLGEGRFPSTERRDPLDLRGVKRALGDVSPSERDKYVFLESLLSARDSFHVSWVARDPLTGDAIPPSPVVARLLDMVERHYVLPDELPQVRRRSTLRRHEGARADAALRESVAEAKAAAAPQRDDLRQDVALRDLLALSALPKRSTETVREVSLGALRHFLVAPAQGWARAVLRLDRQREEARSGKSDEPLRAEALDRSEVLRNAFETGLRERRKPLSVYDEKVPRLAAMGRWPLGILAERAREVDAGNLEAWQRAYLSAVHAHTEPTRVRFGSGRAHGESAIVRPAIEIEVELEGRMVPIRLVGRTEALVEGGHSSLLLLARSAPAGGKLLTERLLYALRGYLDALALAADPEATTSNDATPRDASGLGARSHRALVLFSGDAAREASTRFAGITQEEAKRILSRLVASLLRREHAYYLPCQAVFRLARGWATATPEKLHQASMACRRSALAQYGPLRGAQHLPLLEPEDAFLLAVERFNPFFAATQMNEAGPT